MDDSDAQNSVPVDASPELSETEQLKLHVTRLADAAARQYIATAASQVSRALPAARKHALERGMAKIKETQKFLQRYGNHQNIAVRRYAREALEDVQQKIKALQGKIDMRKAASQAAKVAKVTKMAPKQRGHKRAS